MIFIFQFVCMVAYIYINLTVLHPLHLWDEVNLILVNNLYDVLWDSVWKYFLSIFAFKFIGGIGQ